MKKRILFLMFVALTSISGWSQNAVKRAAEFNLDGKVAIQGYDPVAFFKQKAAVKGKKELSAAYQGVTYYFSSAANKDAFAKNPSAYEPQYGGWCAFAMGSNGEKVDVDPATFKILNGKLYLFYNKFFNNTLKAWNKDEASLKKKADENWKKFIK